MKGGLVCFVWAYRALLSLGFRPAADLYIQSVVEEECTGTLPGSYRDETIFFYYSVQATVRLLA
jgi:acetylornithine deacetylase/succinyl-diaminopimelate desuccinylase-like protein